MKKTETRVILEICQEGVQDSDVIDYYIEEVKDLASNNPIEFEALVNFFNEEKSINCKLCIISEILVFLKWKPIIKYFYEVIEENNPIGLKIVNLNPLIQLGFLPIMKKKLQESA